MATAILKGDARKDPHETDGRQRPHRCTARRPVACRHRTRAQAMGRDTAYLRLTDLSPRQQRSRAHQPLHIPDPPSADDRLPLRSRGRRPVPLTGHYLPPLWCQRLRLLLRHHRPMCRMASEHHNRKIPRTASRPLENITKIAAQTLDGYLFTAYPLSRTVVQTFRREVEPLLQIRDAYPKILLARTHHEESDYEGISIIDIPRWLLD